AAAPPPVGSRRRACRIRAVLASVNRLFRADAPRVGLPAAPPRLPMGLGPIVAVGRERLLGDQRRRGPPAAGIPGEAYRGRGGAHGGFQTGVLVCAALSPARGLRALAAARRQALPGRGWSRAR